MGSVAPDDTIDTDHTWILDLGAGWNPVKNITLGEKHHAKGLGVDQHHHLEEGYVAAMLGAWKALCAPGIIHRQTTGTPGTMYLIHLSMAGLSTGRTI